MRPSYPLAKRISIQFISGARPSKTFFSCSLLKIWNMNNCTGVLGIFNCQGAGTWPCIEGNITPGPAILEISGLASPSDIEYLDDLSGDSWAGNYAVFSFKTGISLAPSNGHGNLT